MLSGYYYLHTNGELIYKPDYDGIVADFRDSDLVRCFWPMDAEDRAGAWRILVEASALGANQSRIKELAEKWGCNDADAPKYAEYLGLQLDDDGTQKSVTYTAPEKTNGSVGYGKAYLEAFANLAVQLGLQAGKMWNATFEDLCKVK